eukprot:5743033-Heterocapsa_arctica.AAC.1
MPDSRPSQSASRRISTLKATTITEQRFQTLEKRLKEVGKHLSQLDDSQLDDDAWSMRCWWLLEQAPLAKELMAAN